MANKIIDSLNIGGGADTYYFSLSSTTNLNISSLTASTIEASQGLLDKSGNYTISIPTLSANDTLATLNTISSIIIDIPSSGNISVEAQNLITNNLINSQSKSCIFRLPRSSNKYLYSSNYYVESGTHLVIVNFIDSNPTNLEYNVIRVVQINTQNRTTTSFTKQILNIGYITNLSVTNTFTALTSEQAESYHNFHPNANVCGILRISYELNGKQMQVSLFPSVAGEQNSDDYVYDRYSAIYCDNTYASPQGQYRVCSLTIRGDGKDDYCLIDEPFKGEEGPQGASIWSGEYESFGGVAIDVGTSNIKPLVNDLVIIAKSTPPTAKKVGDVYKITRLINSTNPYQCYIGSTPLFSLSSESENTNNIETGILMIAADPQAETELDISSAVYIKLVLLSTDSDNTSDGVFYINALDDETPSDSRNDVEINVSEKKGIGATIEFGQYADMGAFVKYDEGIGSTSGTTYTWLNYSLNSSHKILLKFRSRTSSTTLNVLYEIIRHN